MSRHVTWKEVVEEAIHGGWGGEFDNREHAMRTLLSNGSHQTIIIALLADIAQSLRPLQCPNFSRMPQTLDGIRRDLAKLMKKRRRKIC